MSEEPRYAAATGAPELPKRFYKAAEVAETESHFAVALDGRPVRTPSRNRVLVPTRALADALAEEWSAQGERIDPRTMPLNRLVNSALDGVSGQMDAVLGEVANYAGSDLLCYRADGPDTLVERQTAGWDPLIDWARTDLGARFALAEGVMFVKQDPAAIEAVRAAIADLGPIPLAAVNVVTTLTGSAILALAVLRGRLDAETAWSLAHIDEDWNVEKWGVDDEAAQRRENRWRDMLAAVQALELSRAG
jgi:chaperone required for assembly of F1-ATPase